MKPSGLLRVVVVLAAATFAPTIVEAVYLPEQKDTSSKKVPQTIAQLKRPVDKGNGRPQPTANLPYVPDQLIVKFKPDVSRKLSATGYKAQGIAGSLDALTAKHRVTTIEPVFKTLHNNRSRANALVTAQAAAQAAARKYPQRQQRAPAGATPPALEDVYLLKLAENVDVLQAMADYRKDPNVLYAEPNYLATTQMEPNDPYYHSSGSWGQSYDDLWGIKKAHSAPAWDVSQAEGIVVAVIDTGVDYNHPDLAGNIWHNPGEIPGNGLDDDSNGLIDDVKGWDFAYHDADPSDVDGHGTHVAGTIAAVGNNATGVIGIAPQAKVMIVKGLNDNGSGGFAGLAAAVMYAADHGASVTNNSWGAPITSQVLTDAFNYAGSLGVLNIAAAGNSNINVSAFAPANLPNVMAVAAVDHQDHRAFFSNYGAKIDVSAPGVDILSLNANGGNNHIAQSRPNLVVGTHYLRLSGTSMACPHVAGLAALLLKAYPADSAQMIQGRLMAGADSIESLNPGFEDALGTGRINATRSLDSSPQPVMTLQRVSHSVLSPGRESTLDLDLKNFWQEARGVIGTLTTTNPYVTVTQHRADFGDIPMGQTRTHAPAFRIGLDNTTPWGELLSFALTLSGSGGMTTTRAFTRRVTLFALPPVPTNLPLNELLTLQMSTADYNNDGNPDVFVVDYDSGQLFHNNGDGTFTGVEPRVTGTLWHYASIFLDIDNDGDQDLFVGGQTSRLFLNQGSGTFSDISASSGLSSVMSYAPVAMDYDQDGWADLVDGHVYKNNGNRTFTLVTSTGLPGPAPWEFPIVLAFDYDNDVDQDVWWMSRLYRHNGDGTFTNVTDSTLDPAPKSDSVQAVAIGDYDNDGYTDLFMSCWDSSSLTRSAKLYRNAGGGKLVEVPAAGFGTSPPPPIGYQHGTVFLDYDNDGDLDLYLVNSGDIFSGRTHNLVWRNNGDGTFTEVTDQTVPEEIRPGPGSSAAAIGDVDYDGALDVIATGSPFSLTNGALLKNLVGTQRHWFKIKLQGVTSNRDALGARIIVKAGGITQYREVHTAAVETQPIHFGLGSNSSIGEIEVKWPSGASHIRRNVKADQLLTIREDSRAVNQPPVFTSLGRQTVFESRTLTLMLQATDPDGEPLTYAVHPGTLPAGATLTGQTFRWPTTLALVAGHAHNSRIVPVTFSVSDGADTVSQTVPIEVYNMDIDVNGDGLVNVSEWITTGRATAGLITDPAILARADFNRTGSVTITDWVWSGIVVSLVNQAPVLSPIGNRTTPGGGTVTFQVTASDPNQDILTYSASGLPAGASFDPVTRTFTWIPASTQAGTHKATFKVTDLLLNDSEEVTLTVTAPAAAASVVKSQGADLRAAWRFEGNANDDSGNGNHGTVNRATAVEGKVGKAYLFNSASNGITIPWSSSLAMGGGDMTVAAWVYPNTIGNYQTVYDNAGRYYSFWIYNSGGGRGKGYVEFGGTQANGWINIQPAFTAGSWQHLVVMRQGQTLKVYRNGVLAGSRAFRQTGRSLPRGTALSIGANPSGGGTRWDGKIDEFRLYDRALTDAEIRQLMQR